MPKTIQDAVVLTREIGLRYIWIDALCIIQDSREDFLREAAVMGDIYSHAELTIAVKDSADCSGGCFRERSRTSTAVLPLDLRIPSMISHWGRTSRVSRLMAGLESGKANQFTSVSSPVLDSRAWTLQEDLLSPRVLHCTDSGLAWACLRRQCSESNPDWSYPAQDWFTNIKWALAVNTDLLGDTLDPVKVFRHWANLLEDYTKRKLSHTSDKLIAVSGLQSRIGDMLQDTPTAGGWRDKNFFLSLLWKCQPSSPSGLGPGLVCPSWSWASTGMAITYLVNPRYEMTAYELQLKSWNLNVIEENVHITGSITLQGVLFQESDFLVDEALLYPDEYGEEVFKDMQLERPLSRSPGRSRSPVREYVQEYVVMSALSFIHKDPPFPDNKGKVCYLLIASTPYKPRHGSFRPPSAFLMCLEKTSKDSMQFRRVGLAETQGHQAWRDRGIHEAIELF